MTNEEMILTARLTVFAYVTKEDDVPPEVAMAIGILIGSTGNYVKLVHELEKHIDRLPNGIVKLVNEA